MVRHRLHGTEMLAVAGPKTGWERKPTLDDSFFEVVAPVITHESKLGTPFRFDSWVAKDVFPFDLRYSIPTPFMFPASEEHFIQEGNFIVYMGAGFLRDANFVSPESLLDSTIASWNTLELDSRIVYWVEGSPEEIFMMMKDFAHDIFTLALELAESDEDEGKRFSQQAFSLYTRIKIPAAYDESWYFDYLCRHAYALICLGRINEYRTFKAETQAERWLLTNDKPVESDHDFVWNF